MRKKVQKPKTEVLPFPTQDQWSVDFARVSDTKFVIDSWCSDEMLWTGRPSGIDEEVFKVGQRGRILRLLGSSRCVVARLTPAYFAVHPTVDKSKDVMGWCMFSLDRKTLRPVIHFVYVKAEFRGHGIMKELLYGAGVRPEKGAWCTHMRHRLKKAAEDLGIIYNYFLLDYDPSLPTR